MTIIARLFRLCKADLHGVMDQIEDKGLLLKQYLREMESSLQQKEARQLQLDEVCRQINRDLSRQSQECEKLGKELDLAVNKDKDDIAKMLIRKRRTLQTGVEALHSRLQQIEEERRQLAGIVTQQQRKYQELKAKVADYYRLVEQRPFGVVPERMSAACCTAPFTEEEIDFELQQRKAALKQGGET